MKKASQYDAEPRRDEILIFVGVGASADGLEAFQDLLLALDNTEGLVIVFVQLLDNDSALLLPELLSKSTSMPIVVASRQTRLRSGSIYVCPSWTLPELRNGTLRISKPKQSERPLNPIDHFFQSLAEDQGERSVGVILSGTGADGTLGLKSINDAGGMTIAQFEGTETYDSIPRIAATIGVADHILTPIEIAVELKKYARYCTAMMTCEDVASSLLQIHDAIPAVTKRLADVTTHNFLHYKPNTLGRRIRRRMQVLKLNNVHTYLKVLEDNPEEPHQLFRELLISVTSFFRDREAFEILAHSVISPLFAQRDPDEFVRIWVPGCASGEEAFTLAMLCREAMDSVDQPPGVQIFASDIDEQALKVGRLGVYPSGIVEDLTEERLKRFFLKRGNKYQVTKKIREMVLFSTHNLISDPPFSRIDLISCRNLLIYLGVHLQQKLIPLFHYALRPSGFLMLGPSENISSHAELFRSIDAKFRISQRKATGLDASAPIRPDGNTVNLTANDLKQPVVPSSDTSSDLIQAMHRIVMDEFAPKSVIVEEDGKILCASADMHKYLTVGTGKFQNNIVRMARAGLRNGLRASLHKAKTKRRRVTLDNLSTRVDGRLQRVMLTVQPMPRVGNDVQLFLVVFQDCGLPLSQDQDEEEIPTESSTQLSSNASQNADEIIDHLERELSSTREDLEKSVQEYETTNEELKSSNEELLSINEELQSANEELATSKEEIQSAITAIGKAHCDLENLFQSTQIATLFLDANEHVIRFTPAACELYNLIASDVGRPLGHITHNVVEMPPVPTLNELKLANHFVEQEIQSRKGRWYVRRVLPYAFEGQTQGVILTFIDITDRKLAANRLAAMHEVTRLLVSDAENECIFPEALRAISSTMNAAYCALWLVDSGAQCLRCAHVVFDANKPAIQEFADERRQASFELGTGIPGRVWRSGKLLWVEESQVDNNFPRVKSTGEAGLHSGIAFPVIIESTVYGVIELFTLSRLEQDDVLQDMLCSMGNEMGQFIARRHLTERLRDEEARKSAVLEAALDAIITMDVDGRIVDFNPAAESAFGFSRSEVQGTLLSEAIIPPEYREAHKAGLARYLKHGTSKILGHKLELIASRKDGSTFPIEIAINATTKRDRTPFFTAHIRDITEEKQFLQKITDRDNRITALLNSTAEGIYGIDLNGICTFANASCARLLGFMAPEELIGRNMHDLIHHTRPGGQPYPLEECKIQRAFRLGEPVHIDDEVYWRSDGTSFDVEYWSYPQVSNGTIIGCVVSFLDISDRKRWAVDLADRESNLRRVIDNMLGFVGVLDANGVLQEANQTALVAGGLTRDDVIGKPFWECYWWSYDPQIMERLKSAVAKASTGEVVRYDVEVRMADGLLMAIDFMLAPIRDETGTVTHLIPSGVDISERKFAELEVLQRVNQLNLALEAGRMGLWEWEVAVDRVTWSSQLYDVFGYTEETFRHTKAGFLATIHSDDRPKLERMIQSAMTSTCVSHEVEFRVIRGDTRETVWTHSRGTVHRDQFGNPTSIISVSVDITERKRRELTLAFLAELQTNLTLQPSADEIMNVAGEKVAEYLQLSHFLCVKMDQVAEKAKVDFDYCTDGSQSLVGVYDMADFADENERRQLRSGVPMVVNDTTAVTRSPQFVDNFSRLQIGAILNAPSRREQQLSFMLSATKPQPHVWREDEIYLLRELSNILRLKLDRAHAESALRESEAKFRDLADNISQFAWMTDPTGAIFWYNQRWFDYTGSTLEEMKDWGWKLVQHPDHVDRVVKHWQECLASGNVWEDTFPLRAKNGEYRWFLSRAQPIRDEEGHIARWFGTNTDITETKNAEESLRNRQEELRLGVEVAKFALARIDYENNRVHLSRQAAQLYGLGDIEMVVSRDQIHATFHPEDRDHLLRVIEQSLDPTNPSDVALEHRILMPDGQTRWLDVRERVYFDHRVTPPRPHHGVLAAEDISIEKHWEKELAESKERLAMAMASARMGSYEWEIDSDIVVWDDQHLAITGMTRNEATGANFLKRVHPDDAESNLRAIENTISDRCDYNTEFRFIRPDGQIRWFAARGKIIEANIERPRRFVGLNWDITDEKEQAQRIREGEERLRVAAEAANRSKSEFLANMSHEIRTPMTAILGYLDLVVEKIQDDEVMQHMRTIHRNGDYLLGIINDILDLSKIEAGKFELDRIVFAPHHLVADVRSIMEGRARENDIRLDVEYRSLVPNQIESDPKRIKQVLINLVGNAIKFTPSGSVTIAVTYLETKQHLQFDVIDSGIGISEQQQTELFQPFSQGDGTVNREFGGTGLGLAISKRLTEMLGGEIRVVSKLGQGSKFTMTIPARFAQSSEMVKPEVEPNEAYAESYPSNVRISGHILVVDDRRDIRFLSSKFLTDAGAKVSEAEDGEVALKVVNDAMEAGEKIDLILLDMQMPRLDGYQTAKALRQIGYHSPIIALTADAMQGDMNRCLESGCNDYLSKPIDRNKLLALVQKLVG